MKIRKRLSTKFIVRVLIILLIGQSLLWYWSYCRHKTMLENDLKQRILITATLLENTAAAALVSNDYTFLKQIIEKVYSDEDIVSVEVYDSKGNPVLVKTHEGKKKNIQRIELPIKTGAEVVVGKIIARYSIESVKKELRVYLLTTFVFQGLLFIVLVFLIYFFFQKNVGTRVEDLRKSMVKVTSGDLTESVKTAEDDELGSIAKGLGFLIEQLSGTIKKLKAVSSDVFNAMSQLNTIFKNVIDVVDRQHKSTEEVSAAVRNATEAQRQIAAHTEKLLSLSGDNLSMLLETSATSEQIAVGTNKLSHNIDNSYSTVTELAHSSRQIASMASEVSTAVEQASASVEQINATVKEVESIIKESARLSNQTTIIISEKGMLSINNAIESMRVIKEFVNSFTETMEILGKRSVDIEKILSVIKNVTEETSLLSLNAAILAAHAGEYGKGFSVVADEMRSLSEKTAVSTREIATIISTIQKEIKSAVEGTREVVRMVEGGSAVVLRTGGVLGEILRASETSTEMAKNIERVAAEQTKGLELILSAIEQIKKMIFDVNKAAGEQDKSTGYLFEGIGSIRESMEAAMKVTSEQAKSTTLITDNIELARERTSEIAKASAEQEMVNKKIIAAMEEIMIMGNEMLNNVKETSLFLSSVFNKVEALGKEMELFRIDKQ